MKHIILNGKEAVFGRLASNVAKELLKGNSVSIINSEEIIISGKKDGMVDKIKQKRKMGSGGSLKGPTYIKQPDRLVKRMIRGMLPWDKPKGRAAYKRLKCYNQTGDLTEEQIKGARQIITQKPSKYITIKEIINALK